MFSNKDLQKLIVPLIVEQILLMPAGIADIVMISCAGEAGISGVALVGMVNHLVITVSSAVVTGDTVIVFQYLGNEERENVNRTASQLFPIVFLISVGITALCLLLCREILGALFEGVEAEAIRVAQDYLFVTSYFFPFLGIYNSSSASLRSANRTKTVMYVSFLMNIISVAGNVVEIFIFHAGVAGVAIPALLSRVVAAITMPILSTQSGYEICITWRNLVSWNQGIAVWVLKTAVPGGVEDGLSALGRTLMASIIAPFGTTQIVANGVAGSIDQIASIATSAMNLAIISVAGWCIGVGKYDQATYYTKEFVKITYVLIGGMGDIVIVILPFTLGFYKLSEETCKISVLLIILHNVLAFLLHPTSFMLANSLRVVSDVEITIYIGIGSMVAFRSGTAVLFGIISRTGIAGVWVAMGMDWFARATAFSIRCRSGKWRCIKVIQVYIACQNMCQKCCAKPF